MDERADLILNAEREADRGHFQEAFALLCTAVLSEHGTVRDLYREQKLQGQRIEKLEGYDPW